MSAPSHHQPVPTTTNPPAHGPPPAGNAAAPPGFPVLDRWFPAHNTLQYPHPHDDKELQRLDLLHAVVYEHLLPLADGRAVEAMAPTGAATAAAARRRRQRRRDHRARACVLDVGCGTGIWALEFAQRYPRAWVEAVDLRAVPAAAVAPANVCVHGGVDVGAKGWARRWRGWRFDYVRCGQLDVAGVEWGPLLRRVFRLLGEGGVVEVMDFDWRPQTDGVGGLERSHLMLWWRALMTFRPGIRYGATAIAGALRSAGFVGVVHQERRVCNRADAGVSEGDEEVCTTEHMHDLLTSNVRHFEAHALLTLSSHANFTPQQVRDLCERAMKDAETHCVHHYLHSFTARKPELQA